MGALDAPVQGASLCIEIKLAAELRELDQKWRTSRPFPGKKSLAYFPMQTHQISLFASLDTLNNFFLYKIQKQPILSRENSQNTQVFRKNSKYTQVFRKNSKYTQDIKKLLSSSINDF